MAKKTAPPKARPFTPKDVGLGLSHSEDVGHPHRWGIMGTGEICRQFVCAAREVPGATIAGVASRSAENAYEFAQTHGVAKAFDCYEDLIADPDTDIVYVGTPDVVHKAHPMLCTKRTHC